MAEVHNDNPRAPLRKCCWANSVAAANGGFEARGKLPYAVADAFSDIRVRRRNNNTDARGR